MIITNKQFEKISAYLPIQRGNVSVDNITLVNAILYIAENGYKWRALPSSYGKWYTIDLLQNLPWMADRGFFPIVRADRRHPPGGFRE